MGFFNCAKNLMSHLECTKRHSDVRTYISNFDEIIKNECLNVISNKDMAIILRILYIQILACLWQKGRRPSQITIWLLHLHNVLKMKNSANFLIQTIKEQEFKKDTCRSLQKVQYYNKLNYFSDFKALWNSFYIVMLSTTPSSAIFYRMLFCRANTLQLDCEVICSKNIQT